MPRTGAATTVFAIARALLDSHEHGPCGRFCTANHMGMVGTSMYLKLEINGTSHPFR